MRGWVFALLLLASSSIAALTAAADPTATLSVQVVPSSGTSIPCDHGDPYVLQSGTGYINGIPAGAYAAGYLHCSFHSAFKLASYSDTNNWLACAVGAGNGPGSSTPLWYQNHVNGGGIVPCPGRFSMVQDGDQQVLQITASPSDLVQFQAVGAGIATVDDSSYNRGVDFPNGAYYQSTFRITPDSLYNNPVGAHLGAFWSWSDTGVTKGGGFNEKDFFEYYANSANQNDSGMPGYNGVGACGAICYFIIAGFGHPTLQVDPTVYNTFGTRITQNGTNNMAQCDYINGVQQVCGDFISAGYAVGDTALFNQRNYVIIDMDNPGTPTITAPVTVLVEDVVIFTCDGGVGPLNTQGNACNGPVLTSQP